MRAVAFSIPSPLEHAHLEPSDKRSERHVAAAGSSDKVAHEPMTPNRSTSIVQLGAGPPGRPQCERLAGHTRRPAGRRAGVSADAHRTLALDEQQARRTGLL